MDNEISVGEKYYLDVDSHKRDELLPWVEGRWAHKPPAFKGYSKWGDLHGEVVIVKGFSFKHLGKVVICPDTEDTQGPGLAVSVDWLVPMLDLQITCTCDIRTLMASGCKCGAVQAERKLNA